MGASIGNSRQLKISSATLFHGLIFRRLTFLWANGYNFVTAVAYRCPQVYNVLEALFIANVIASELCCVKRVLHRTILWIIMLS